MGTVTHHMVIVILSTWTVPLTKPALAPPVSGRPFATFVAGSDTPKAMSSAGFSIHIYLPAADCIHEFHWPTTLNTTVRTLPARMSFDNSPVYSKIPHAVIIANSSNSPMSRLHRSLSICITASGYRSRQQYVYKEAVAHF